MRGYTIAVAALVLVGTVAPVATAADGSSSGDAGAHVSYDVDGSTPDCGEETAESTERRDAAGDTAGGATPDAPDDPSSSTSSHRMTLAALITMAAGVLARGI